MGHLAWMQTLPTLPYNNWLIQVLCIIHVCLFINNVISHTCILARVASTVINILVTIFSIESWLTVTLVSAFVVSTSSIRMTRFFSFTFINVHITCSSSESRSNTVTSEVVNFINTRTCSTRRWWTVIYILITCLSLKACASQRIEKKNINLIQVRRNEKYILDYCCQY